MNNIPESDWKYMRSIKDELLETLCERINRGSSQIITNPDLSECEKFLELFEHVNEENKTVGRCFDDWRRSNILIKMLLLRGEGLLTDRYLRGLSEETQSRITEIEREPRV